MTNNLAVYYTDDEYLSKRELQDALKTSLVDGYWNDVLLYRKPFQKALGFRSITKRNFYCVLSPAIQSKVEIAEKNLAHLVNQIKKAEPGTEVRSMERTLVLSSLAGINRAYGSITDELTMKAIINGTYRDFGEGKEKHLQAYLSTLKMCLKDDPLRPDENFLAKVYGSLLGEGDDLTKWYRQGDFDNRISKNSNYVQSDYPYAPAANIDSLMDDFYPFVDSNFSPLVKALASLFFFVYVKPFESKNEEIATLFALDILAYEGGFGKEAFYLPLSQTLIVEPVLQDNYFIGAQRAGDLTYYFMRSIKTLNDLFGSLKKELDAIRLERFEKEEKTLSKEEEVSANIAQSLSEASNEFPSFGEEKIETGESLDGLLPHPEEINSSVVEKNNVHSDGNSSILPNPNKAKKKTLPTISKEEMRKANGGDIAITKKDSPLTDKEIKEYIRYLLESNYSLNKSQAAFLANHCMIGHYYSIQQYKKFAHCAYETARTSMEKLVNEGYYNKLQVKNKFVYTPVKQDEK